MRLAVLAFALAGLGLAPGCGRGSSPGAAPIGGGAVKRVILVSVDGLMPATYLAPDSHGLRVPNLRRFAREGAIVRGLESVFPSVTYPAHTTIATGQEPAVHGIATNRRFDPLEANQGGWHWYAEDIASPTLWQRAREAGHTTAIVNWPVTVGAEADFNVPEFWRAGTTDDVKLARALTSPRGLLEKVAASHPGFAAHFTPPDVRDSATGDIIDHLLRRHQPSLIMAHMWWVDEMQHRHDIWSDPAKAAIEAVDAELGRLVATLAESGLDDDTTLVIVSDHGFASIDREVSPGVILAGAGFIDVTAGGDITGWRASAIPDGGTAYIYIADDAADGTLAAVEQLFVERSTRPAQSGVATVLDAAAIRARGGDPRAALAVLAAPGFGFTRGVTGPEIIAAKSAAIHGYAPERADMRASLIIWGGGVGSRDLGAAALVDVAPTVAGLLGLPPLESPGRDLLARDPTRP